MSDMKLERGDPVYKRQTTLPSLKDQDNSSFICHVLNEVNKEWALYNDSLKRVMVLQVYLWQGEHDRDSWQDEE